MFVELNEKQDRIQVTFPYDAAAVARVKALPGARFVAKDKGGPYWWLPLDLTTARRLRESFPDMKLGVGIQAWGRDQTRLERNLASLVAMDDIPVEDLVIATKLPEMAEWLRPYQRADVKFLSTVNTLNGNQPGLGKTAEIIGAIYEGNMEHGLHLVVGPKTSLDNVWRMEFERWTDIHVITYHGDLSKGERAKALSELWSAYREAKPCVFVCTADAIRRGIPQERVSSWTTFTIDEFHLLGLTNVSGDPTKGTQFGRAAVRIDADHKWCMSGTPMGGKPIKLWGVFHFLHPEVYTSKWRWAETWLEVTHNGFGYDIGGIKKDREEEFYAAHAKHMVRRLKSEVLKQLPPKQYVEVWCEMGSKQAKQYTEFAKNAEVRIEEEKLSAQGILAEYARLKFFSFSHCNVERQERVKTCSLCKGEGCTFCGSTGKVDHLKLKPTKDSGKLAALLERLAELGITAKDPDGDAVAVVFSQHKEVVDFITDYLNELGIKTEKITGDVKQQTRTEVQAAFQSGEIRVVCMTTKAGGVSITLDRADTVHILDETWVPDDQEQAEDRIHRASRMHQVTCYYYRTRGTVDEQIQDLTSFKASVNEAVLDLRRQGYRADVAAKKKG